MCIRALVAAACVQYMCVSMLWLKSKATGQRRPRSRRGQRKIHARPSASDRIPGRKDRVAEGRVVRPTVLIRAPARGGIVRRSREPPHARLNDLGSILGHRGEHHSVAAAAHRL